MTLHPAVLTPEQQVVLKASTEVAQKWQAYLAGGVGLALQLGHRRSVDFDWFTRRTLPPAEVLDDVRSFGLSIHVRKNEEGTFLGQVGGVDYSLFRYRYELVGRSVSFEGCQVASLEDIAAVKMTAIVQRATKRDYVDLYAIFRSGTVGLRDVVSTMERKYPGVDPSLARRALTYFEDVERQPMPEMLRKTTWNEVKAGLMRVRSRDIDRGGPSR